MSSNRKLNKKDIINLLSELGNMLYEDNILSILYLYGGAVMCCEFELRESTFDVDCIFTDNKVKKYANRLAKKHNIQDNWLNDAILEIVTEDMKKKEVYKELEFKGLTVVIPTARQMLAMKIFSGRLGISDDLDDAIKLCRELKINNRTQLQNILNEFFKKNSIRDRNKRYNNIIGKFINALEVKIK